MVTWWRELQRARAAARKFKDLPRHRRRIVFYAEGRGYWTYFAPVFEALRASGEEVLYLTSGAEDPLLSAPPQGLTPFFIGAGSVRTLLFVGLEADILLTTTPDLQSFFIKRSPHGVHYVYLHHSLVSTHMVYRTAAFDHFDAILCAGPHHVAEIRAREKQAGLPAKTLVEHGYGRLDAILARGGAGPRIRRAGEPPQVLVAPSWGDEALLERHGADAIEPLLQAGFRVVLRPHPRTLKFRGDVMTGILERYAEHAGFALDENADATQSLETSDLMVSDWSGAALEFALGLERPVVFVDVPRKCQNPEYESLGLEPLEARLRQELGVVVPPGELEQLGARAMLLLEEGGRRRATLQAAREKWVYHPGDSGRHAAAYLRSVLAHRPRQRAA